MDDINRDEFTPENKCSEEGKTPETGYTVTPDGGFYNIPPTETEDKIPEEVKAEEPKETTPAEPLRNNYSYKMDNDYYRPSAKGRSFSLATVIVSVILSKDFVRML